MMKLGALVVTSLILTLSGCAHDRNNEVKSAEADLRSDQQKADNEQAALNQKHAEEQAKADQKSFNRDDRAELAKKQRQENAEARSGNQQDLSADQKDLTKAYASMDQDRRDFDTKSRERLAKLDAKAYELKDKSGKLTAAKKTNFTATWNQYSAERGDTNAKIDKLPQVSNDDWKVSKAKVEKNLDQLEATVDKLGRDL
jgi:hypothetical protein